VYVRRVKNETLEFGHRGWLLDESFIFYDKKYDSLWVQATGRCIDGRFKGEQLPTLPVTHTTWGEWRALHPQTLVLAKPSYLIEKYRHDGYEQTYRVRGTEFGLAVFAADRQKLYPLEELRNLPLVQETIGDQSVLVVFHESSRTAVAFDPTIDGNRMEFELVEVTDTDVLIRDAHRSVVWSGLTGRAISGDEPKPQLRQYRTTQFVVSNWPKHFPDSPVFGTP